MENDLRSVNAKANAGMATGITALGIEAASLLSQNGGVGGLLGGLLGGNANGTDIAALIAALSSAQNKSTDTVALISALAAMQNNSAVGVDTTAIMAMIPALIAAIAAADKSGTCNEDHIVNRYEASQQARIAELETEVKLRDANTYTDQKMLEMYKYIDGQLKSVNGEICRQAVLNQQTADSFKLVEKDIQRERDERCCGDNSIVTYANATFYPKQVADVTTGTTTTAQSLYNPLPNCGGCCRN